MVPNCVRRRSMRRPSVDPLATPSCRVGALSARKRGTLLIPSVKCVMSTAGCLGGLRRGSNAEANISLHVQSTGSSWRRVEFLLAAGPHTIGVVHPLRCVNHCCHRCIPPVHACATRSGRTGRVSPVILRTMGISCLAEERRTSAGTQATAAAVVVVVAVLLRLLLLLLP
jgi:hypothetical protein